MFSCRLSPVYLCKTGNVNDLIFNFRQLNLTVWVMNNVKRLIDMVSSLQISVACLCCLLVHTQIS